MAEAPISEELTLLKKRARRRLVGAFVLMLAALVVLWTVLDDKPPQALLNQSVSILSSKPLVSAGHNATSDQPATPGAVDRAQAAARNAPSNSPVEVTDQPKVTPAVLPATAALPASEVKQAPLVADNKPAVQSSPAVSKPNIDAKPVDKHDAKIDVKRDVKPHQDVKPSHDDEKARKAERILNGLGDVSAAAAHKDANAHPSVAADSVSSVFLQIAAFADKSKASALADKMKSAGVHPVMATVESEHGTLTRLRAGPFASKDAAQSAKSKLQAIGISSQIVGAK
ncbi:SPOR domain-containing protein [Burkholderiaceae bacterium DAT-1]|nr:SPOR domain-containing protein [Burkholderiaceae bacterium DAT-1]